MPKTKISDAEIEEVLKLNPKELLERFTELRKSHQDRIPKVFQNPPQKGEWDEFDKQLKLNPELFLMWNEAKDKEFESNIINLVSAFANNYLEMMKESLKYLTALAILNRPSQFYIGVGAAIGAAVGAAVGAFSIAMVLMF